MCSTNAILTKFGPQIANPDLYDSSAFLSSSLVGGAYYGYFGQVTSMIGAKANVNWTDQRGSRAIHYSTANGWEQIVEELVKHRADTDVWDAQGCAPAHLAAMNSNTSVIDILLKYKGDINICDQDGRSPLTIAALFGHVKTVKFLLEKGADVNHADRQLCTPLHYPCEIGYTQVVCLLINEKADINCQDKSGLRAIDYAKRGTILEMVDLLKRMGSEENTVENKINAEDESLGSRQSTSEIQRRTQSCYNKNELMSYENREPEIQEDHISLPRPSAGSGDSSDLTESDDQKYSHYSEGHASNHEDVYIQRSFLKRRDTSPKSSYYYDQSEDKHTLLRQYIQESHTQSPGNKTEMLTSENVRDLGENLPQACMWSQLDVYDWILSIGRDYKPCADVWLAKGVRGRHLVSDIERLFSLLPPSVGEFEKQNLREEINLLLTQEASHQQTQIAQLESEIDKLSISTPLCVVCMDAPREIIFQPCKHAICCERCSQDSVCAFCRVPVQSRDKIYF